MAQNVRVTVPNRSSHSLSCRRTGTATCGTLVPVLCKELIAGSKFSLSAACKANLAPLATDAYMRTDLKFEAFAIPHRVISAAFPKWLTGEPIRQLSNGSINQTYAAMPYIQITKGSGSTDWKTYAKSVLGAGSLMDYLGMRFTSDDFDEMDALGAGAFLRFSPLKMLAYHKVWSDWYRNAKVQLNCFTDSHNTVASNYFFGGNLGGAIETVASSPYQVQAITTQLGANWTNAYKLADDVNLFSLRQRNFGYDYFTNATINAQLGSAQTVSTTGNSFTISSLRAANSLQMWLERSQLGSYRWQDYLHAHYGTTLSSGIAQRSIYLGRYNMNVATKGVEQTANTNPGYTASAYQADVTINRNPFRYFPGARYGNAFIQEDGRIVDEVVFDEPVFIMVMMSLVPKVTYSSGIDRELQRYTVNGSVTDHADALLQNVGNQPIFTSEICGEAGCGSIIGNTPFGYTDRYADWMTSNDTVNGELRDGQCLEAFALQRHVGRNGSISPSISSAFLEIPKDYLKQILVYNPTILASYNLNVDLSGFDYEYDVLFDFPVSHPLHEYSIPSLQDPSAEHGHDVTINTFAQL